MVNNLFDKPIVRAVSIGGVFEAQYRENKGSKMQYISLMQKSKHLFMNKTVLRRREIRSTADFSLSNIRKYVSIVVILERKR